MKKGFTLIEMLGVILIIGVIATIVTITIDSSIKNSRVSACQAQEKNIIEAAKVYLTDKPQYYPDKTNGNKYSILLKTLQENGYIDEDLENPITNSKFNANTVIVVTYNNGYIYSVLNENGNPICSN